MPVEFAAIAGHPVGKIAKAVGLRIDRAGKGAERDLVVVARVDDDRVGVGDQRVPVAGLDIGAGAGERVDVGHAHRHDLPLQPHLHAVERHFGSRAVFDLEAGEFRHGFEMGDQLGDRRLAAGDRAVDAFAGEEQRALDAAPAAEGGERRAQLFAVVEPHEAVERRDAEGSGWREWIVHARRR